MSLELRNIHKHFGAVRANDGITLTVETGTLHGLLGENGAGKSTLMKVLSGFHSADSGEIVLDGRPITLASPADAIAAGIGMLHQDPLVFLPFNVLDNFLLGSPGTRRLDRRAAASELQSLCDRYGFNLDPSAPARLLTVGERQQLEIVRLLWLGARVLILDEPTTGISADQRAKLFTTLRALAEEGMSVIFVSHKLEEVADLCRRVTVMTRGKVVGEAVLPTPPERLVEMMFGQAVEIQERDDVALGASHLTLERVRTADGLLSEEPISLDVKAGEVVGIAGMEGSGQDTFLRLCCGMRNPKEGTVAIAGRDLTGKHYREYLASHVKYLPAGRLEEGLIEGLTISEHFLLAGEDPGLLIDWGSAHRRSEEQIEHYGIKGRKSSTAESLSGGNQQRLLLAMLPPELTLLLMEHPTRGLDIESANWVWEQLLARRHQGTSIVFASADLDELLRYSDRILVFFSGRIIGELDAGTATVDELGLLIGGRRSAAGEVSS
ncbi:MAG: ATP-binding cassette domain-containing protein [Acidimicrobiia bacterium]|nr:ATP-binding cassette domain-containing protein [Acidimicrobiia bacterium]RZV43513.1 MAG: ATP-binding cassette domain-containing protein [Acidimicrobiia bacterium]